MDKANVKVKSQHKVVGKSGAGSMKVFRQTNLNTVALDNTYDRVGSVSPLKYRPKVDFDGLEPREDNDERSRSNKRRNARTPDPMASRGDSPERS